MNKRNFTEKIFIEKLNALTVCHNGLKIRYNEMKNEFWLQLFFCERTKSDDRSSTYCSGLESVLHMTGAFDAQFNPNINISYRQMSTIQI